MKVAFKGLSSQKQKTLPYIVLAPIPAKADRRKRLLLVKSEHSFNPTVNEAKYSVFFALALPK